MAALQERGGTYRILFRYRGKQQAFPIGKVSLQEAQAKVAQTDYLLMRLAQKLIQLPPGMDIAAFLEHDGQPPQAVTNAVTKNLTLGHLRDRFIQARAGGREESTQYTTGIHFKHLAGTLSERFPISELTHADLQRHVERRTASGISATTARKEITTLRTAWHWAVAAGLLAGDYPNKALVYPKIDEPPPFQTFDEIEWQIKKGKLDEEQRAELWECLYLRVPEVAELLECVRGNAIHPWIYPFVCMAAHTGMRRSELLRIKITDVDFEGSTVLIRERKRVKGTRSTRRAPLTPLLRAALEEWLIVHPGGNWLFCHAEEVPRSSKRSRTTGHQNGKDRSSTSKGRMATVRKRERPAIEALTVNECHDHFKRTIRETRWAVVRGLHTLRHSLISCMAVAGVDQRIIDDIVGHTDESIKRRYRHLTPAAKTKAVEAVFG